MRFSAGPRHGERFDGPMDPGRLAHLKAEIAAVDRRLKTYAPNVSRETIRQSIRRDRKMRNVGLTAENAFDSAWDWSSPARFSRTPG